MHECRTPSIRESAQPASQYLEFGLTDIYFSKQHMTQLTLLGDFGQMGSETLKRLRWEGALHSSPTDDTV